MADLAEDTLTTADDILYFTLDAAVTISGDVASIPVGWVELDENSSWEAEATGPTGDGQTRAQRGHTKPVVTNRSDTITFNIKPKVDTDPALDREIDVGTILQFLMVRTDGYYRMDLVQVTRVRETSVLAELPRWEGTAEARAHPVRGKVTTWPPGGGMG